MKRNLYIGATFVAALAVLAAGQALLERTASAQVKDQRPGAAV